MSIVSTIVVCCHDGDDDNLIRLNQWIRDRYSRIPTGHAPSLNMMVDGWGGNKAPQMWMAAGAFNKFPEDDFVAFALSLQWSYDDVVIVIQPEDGPMCVLRSEGWDRSKW